MPSNIRFASGVVVGSGKNTGIKVEGEDTVWFHPYSEGTSQLRTYLGEEISIFYQVVNHELEELNILLVFYKLDQMISMRDVGLISDLIDRIFKLHSKLGETKPVWKLFK